MRFDSPLEVMCMRNISDLSKLGEFNTTIPSARDLHERLACWNRRRLAAGPPADDWRSELAQDVHMIRLETVFVESFRTHIAPLVAAVPTESRAFIAWF